MNIEKLKSNPNLPKHLAFIIDGNGRWAKRRGLPRSMGHKIGAENVKNRIESVMRLGIPNLSIYCFSTENWKRPKEEVDYLMQKFDEMLDDYRREYMDKNVRIIVSGDLSDERLPLSCRQKAINLINDTKKNTGLILNICLNYGGRQELVMAINTILTSGQKAVKVEDIDHYLYTKDMYPLDYIIRTSGEKRTSNFMLWQSAYSEWDFPKKMWPEFSEKDLIKSILRFTKRERRFGGLKK